ncbi:MAG: Uma2 family endonuclease [Dehalococcoidia bacterium]|nr:Uma2 family endonuclease [Dehalococcoidia bacterium]
MTTAPKPIDAAAPPVPDDAGMAEPAGTIRLKLAALGIDHRASDFPVQFIEFCEQNDLYEMEVNAAGELLILPMTGYRGNKQENYMNHFLVGWELANGGSASSQTVRFRLPSGEIRGPDAAWITQERFDALSEDEWNRIVEGAPDFVAEIRSRTDDLPPLRNKMALWMAAGARLGWLIDTRSRQVYIYRAGQTEPEVLDNPEALDGEDVLPGFVFPVRQYVFDLAGPEE